MTKYSTTSYGSEITPVKVSKETAYTVTINGRLRHKHRSYERLHDTWDDAYVYLENRLSNRILLLENQLSDARAELKGLKQLKGDT